MLLELRNQPFQSIEFRERNFSGKMSDSGEQGATISGQVSDSDEQTGPSSAQFPDSSGEEAQDSGEAAPHSGGAAPNSGEAAPNSEEAAPNSEENPDSGEASIPEENQDSGEAAPKLEENPDSGEAAPYPEENPDSGEAAEDSEENQDSGEAAPYPEENPNSGEAAPNSEENPDSGEAAEDSEENTESSEPAPPTPANTQASSVRVTARKQKFDFENVRAALAETIPGFVGQQAQVNPLRINFNASGSGEASVAEAPKLMPNPPSCIEDSDEEGASPNEQETDSSDSGEPEVQSAPPKVIIMTPADWKKALSDQAKAEEEEEKENPKEVVPELIHNTNLQQAELKDRAVGHPSLIGGSSKNPDPSAAVQKPDSQPSESAAENVELGKRKIDEKGKGKLEENQEDGGEELSEEEEAASPRSKIPKKSQDERLVIGDPSLQACSNMNPALPPATPVTTPDSQPSESAAENVELGKRKIDEKGKGKLEENREDGREEVSEEEEAASPRSTIPKKSQDERLAIGDPSLQACSNMNPALPPATPVTTPDSSESAAEGKRKIGKKGKGSKGEEESEEDEAASPNSKKLKGPAE